MSKELFKFRLYPDEAQEKHLLAWVETCRRLWNDALAQRKERYEQHGQSTNYYDQCAELTSIRKHNEFVADLYSHVAQDAIRRLEKAFTAFFKGDARYPKFKSFREHGSFTYPDAYNGSVKLGEKKIYLSKIGYVPIVAHREVPPRGILKTCTVKREADHRWYAILLYETEDVSPSVPTTFSSPVGIDLGLTPIIADTDGQKVDPLRAYRKSERRLKHLQKELSRKKRGSRNREKARLRVAKQSSYVARQRMDFNHKLSTQEVKEHDFIAVGNLEVGRLSQRRATAKSFQDAALGQLTQFIKYKAEKYGKKFLLVLEPYTTQDCNNCKTRNSVAEGVMQFICIGCGETIDRQLNSARNILQKGFEMVGKDKPEPTAKPVETAALVERSIVPATFVCETGSIRGGSP